MTRPDVAELAAEVSQERVEATLADLVGERWTADQRAAASKIIRGELEDTGYDVEERSFGDGGRNLVARLDGSDPDAAAVLVGANYDTVKASPGADDNGTGVAAVLEIARVLADTEPVAPVELVLFDLEEPGRLGSIFHAMEATEAGRSYEAVSVFDMIGYSGAKAGCQTPFPDIPDCLDVEPEGVDVGSAVGVLVTHGGSAPLVERLGREVQHPAGQPQREPFGGQLLDQREHHFGSCFASHEANRQLNPPAITAAGWGCHSARKFITS